MKRIIVSLLTVVMLIMMMLPAGVPVVMGQEEDAPAATNQTAADPTADDQTADNQTAPDLTADDQTAGDQTADNQTAPDLTADDQTPADQTADNQTAPDPTADDQTPADPTATNETATIESPLVADFIFDLPTCSACSGITFIDKTSGGVEPYTYDWNFGDGSNSTQQNPEHRYASTGNYTITLIVTDSAGDVASKSETVTLDSAPKADVEPNGGVLVLPATETPFCTTTGDYTVCTDKADYGSGETVHISGSGFAPGATLTIKVIRPDGSVVSGDGSFAPWPTTYDAVIADLDGKFDYNYVLDGIPGEYLVEVLNGDGNLLASHSFTDSRNPVTVTLDGGDPWTPPSPSSNGDPVTVAPGASIEVAFTVEVTGSSEWRATRWRIDSGTWTCVNHADHTSSGTYTATFNITAPSTPGTYDLTVHARNNNDCSSVDTGSFTLTNAIVVEAPFTITSATLNGGPSVTVTPGANITAALTVQVNSPNTWGSSGWRIASSTGSFTCVNTPDHTSGNYTESFNITAPMTLGTYNAYFQVYSGDTCGGSGSNVYTMMNAVVVASAPPVENPPLEESCGLDVVLVIDGSGSIDDDEYADMQEALVAFVEALADTPTEFAFVEFATSAVVRQGFTADETTITNEINEAREQPGGQYTNWQQGLLLAHNLFPNRDNPDLIIFASDGNPNRTGNPAQSVSEAQAVAAAVVVANAAKSDGIRIITIGIGDELDTNNLIAISSADAVITSDFDELAEDLAELAIQLCGGTITVHKVIDCDGDLNTKGDQSNGGNWTFTATVTPPGSLNPSSGQTDNNGLINFDIDFGGQYTATVNITETLKPGFVLLGANCTGATNNGSFDYTDSIDGIAIDWNDIVFCTFYNRAPARALEITAASDSKVYDGTPLTNSGYNITAGSLAAGDSLISVNVTGSQTEVGSSNNTPSNALIKNDGTDVTASYNITYKNGTLTVTPKAIEITAASDSKVYDGTPLTNSGYNITAGSLAAGDSLISVNVTGSQTEVGSSNNTPSNALIKNDGTDVTASYNITYKNGTLTVTPKAIEITAASDSKVYDGTPLTNSGYNITAGSLAAGDSLISVNVTGSQTEVGSSANVPSGAVIKNDGTDVTASYNITYKNGTLTVTPKAIEITAASDSKVYDGTPLTNSGYNITAGSLAAGDSLISVNVTGSQTEVGSSANVPSGAVIKNDGTDVTASYNITYKNGTLTVTPKAIEITAASDSKVYDGTPLTNSGYNITAGSLAAGDSLISVNVTGSQTEVGSSNNTPSNALIKNDGTDVTASYNITYKNGTLTVTPKAIEITAASDSKVYDGTPLTNSGYNITAGSLAAGDSLISVTVTGSQTEVGSSNNTPSNALIKNDGTDVTASYNITYKNGTLTVTPKAIEITAASDSKVYDGTPLTNSGYNITAGSLAAGDSLISVNVTGSQTEVGSSANVPSGAVIKNDGTDVTASYNITYKNGTLTVTPKAIEITAASDSKVYDGTPLTNSGYNITAGSLAAGDSLISVNVTGSQTEVGSSNNTPSNALIKNDGTDVTASYNITYKNGTLTVTPKAIEITAASDSKVYDGTPLTNSGYNITAGSLAAGDSLISVNVTGSQTEVGSSNNTPSNALIKNDGTDVTASYNITYKNGTLTVTPKAIEITAASDSKVYDGTPLTNSGYNITAGSLAAGDSLISVTVTGSQTEVGSSNNTPSNALIKNDGTDATASYNITYKNGTLTVTPKAIEITAASDSKVYDGTPLTNSGYNITAGSLAAGDSLISVTVTGSQTEVGSSANVPSGAVIKNDGTDVTASYNITYKNGTLTVTPKAIEITAASDSKVYDGTPLTNSGYNITAGSLAAGDSLISVTVTGSQTEVGSSNNTPSNALIKNDGTDATASYNITYKNGTLTVTPKAIEITAASDSKVYDGTPLTNSGYNITAGSLAAGDSLISVTVTGSQTEVGSSANVPSGAVIKNDGTDVTASYNITYKNGTLTVTPKAIEITAASDSKVYDGTPLTNSGYNITAGSLAAGDSLISVTVTGSQTEVGSSNNTPSNALIKNDGTDATASYNITYKNGTLTVTPKAIEITAASDSKVYDGTPLTNSGYNITAGSLAAGDSLISVTVTGSQTEVGSSANVPSGAVIKNDGTDVTASYNITYVNGTLTVTAGPTPSPAGGGVSCPSMKYLTVDWEGNNTTEPLYTNDCLAVDLLGPSADLSHNLFLEQGTHAPIVGEKTYYLIVIRELELQDIPPLPENITAIVVFSITPAGAEFNRDIFLTLGLDELQLPQDALNISMAYYDDVNEVWVPLEYEAGGPSGVAELTLSAPINHFSIYGVLAELAPTPTLPAHFVPSGLSIVTSVEKIWEFVTKTGESVTIAANIANDGGQEGTYTVVLKLNGETVDTQTVTLDAGQSQQVSFTRSGLDYGQYDVEVAGLSGEFTTSRTITWWLIIVIIVAIGLIIWGVVWTRRRRKARQAA